ncbi:spore coat U domain-containing protein [Acinetobacter sp. ANC 3791]|uniref:Csu type fimbrial protein n=1 Tax=Acinetobacter sp. ANC 3791 TaxID=2529836 RepID=UPI00103ACC47|nr:spore coat protein U domain-containing protein [Acinetobacter sp. ANC 3791]TCB86447.1 SCPU domain-containing protein [Acinetobacter sp. ANC 3791]
MSISINLVRSIFQRPFKLDQANQYSFVRSFLTGCLLLLGVTIFNSAHATCTVTGTTTGTYTYTASTIANSAPLNFSGTITCTGGSPPKAGTSQYICIMASLNNTSSTTSSVNGTSLPYTVTGSLGGAGSSSTKFTNGVWIGPATTSASNNILSYSIAITIPAQSSTLVAYPIGTYTATVKIYWDMQANSSTICEGNTATGSSNWDGGNMTLTANYIIPSFCQLNSTSAVNFGSISDIGTTRVNYDAAGAVNTTCNYGTAYTIYLDLGKYYNSSTGYRRMYNASSGQYIPYQLYKDSSHSTIWNATGGTSSTGGSGGVSLTGSGSAVNTSVYGRIPVNTTIPTIPNTYSDSVVVTVTY